MRFKGFKEKLGKFMGVSKSSVDVNQMVEGLIRKSITYQNMISVAFEESYRTETSVDHALNELMNYLVQSGYYNIDMLDYIMFLENGYILDETLLNHALYNDDCLAPWDYESIKPKTVNVIYRHVLNDLFEKPDKYQYVYSDQLYAWTNKIEIESERIWYLGRLIQLRPSKTSLKYLDQADIDRFVKIFSDLFNTKLKEPPQVEKLINIVSGVEIISKEA